MNKELQYQGYSAVPSDYESPDGTLAMSLNLINEDGAINGICSPSFVLQLQPNEQLILVHSVAGQDNYIILKGNIDNFELYWMEKASDAKDASIAIPIPNSAFRGFVAVSAIGNTIAVALSDCIEYILWSDGCYRVLGSRPPFPCVSFGMSFAGQLNKHNEIPGTYEDDRTTKTEITNAVYGLLNSEVMEGVTKNGLFHQPLLVRYAYRLYDGTHIWHSAPILMLPTILPPIIRREDKGENIKIILNLDRYSLNYKITSENIDDFNNWRDVIAGIDVFITEPIYRYNQSEDINFRGTLKELLQTLTGQRPGVDGEISGGSTDANRSVFVGHYADDINGRYIDHTMSASEDNYDVYVLGWNKYFFDKIRDANLFYLYSSISFDKIVNMEKFERVPPIIDDLSNLVTREVLKDDYQSHCNLSGTCLYSFNSRLNIADVRLSPALPFSLQSCTQYSSAVESSDTYAEITIWTKLNGQKCYRSRLSKTNADIWSDNPNEFPRYIYYPDASAYKMKIKIGGKEYIFPLESHSFLNGAIYFSGRESLSETPYPTENDEADPLTSTYVNLMSKVYTSEVNNPFYFPVSGINSVGSHRVRSISSAAKALSQGQFGQFPLYAFTDEGVWAMETTPTGTYSAKQPITRDVCINPDGITQIDSAVLFPTDRGIMMISGSQTQCISDAINSEHPFDISSLPGMEKLHSMLNHGEDKCIKVLPFSKFMMNCRMLYDYVHQRIIVFNPSVKYAYVMSLATNQWGLIHSDIRSGINSYPDALAVDGNGRVVNFSAHTLDTTPGILVTRPLKLDAPDVLKTIDAIIQRGHFKKGHVQTVLYGSRDLYNWQLVWSSTDHYLRGFRGTPYKYFRIALLCNLDAGESVFGASINFNPRHTNQIR